MVRKSKKNFRKASCSPMTKRTRNSTTYSCFLPQTIEKLASSYNESSRNRIKKGGDSLETWRRLRQRLRNKCDNEMCWLKQPFASNVVTQSDVDSFAPSAPKKWQKNKNEWLSNFDIIKVMRQYEKTYPCFHFVAPSPMDFDARDGGGCVSDELCKFDVASLLKKGKTKIGIVLNVDKHTSDGSHWVSIFINVQKSTIFYFDSVGDEAPPEVLRFVKRVQDQGRALGKHFVFDQNHPTEHQYGDTECGMYALFFIVHMLEDRATSTYFKTHVISDKQVAKFRKVYFNVP